MSQERSSIDGSHVLVRMKVHQTGDSYQVVTWANGRKFRVERRPKNARTYTRLSARKASSVLLALVVQLMSRLEGPEAATDGHEELIK